MLNSPSFRGYPRWKELYLQEDAWGPLTKTYLEGGGLCNLGNAGVENCSPDDVELQVQGPQFLSLGAREAPRALPSLLPWCQKFALSWNKVSFWGFWDFKDFPNDAHMHPESRTSAPNKLGVTSTSSSLLLHYQGCKQKSYQVLMFLSGLHWAIQHLMETWKTRGPSSTTHQHGGKRQEAPWAKSGHGFLHIAGRRASFNVYSHPKYSVDAG